MFISKHNLEGAKAKQELSVMVLCAYLITNLNLHSFFIPLGTKKMLVSVICITGNMEKLV